LDVLLRPGTVSTPALVPVISNTYFISLVLSIVRLIARSLVSRSGRRLFDIGPKILSICGARKSTHGGSNAHRCSDDQRKACGTQRARRFMTLGGDFFDLTQI